MAGKAPKPVDFKKCLSDAMAYPVEVTQAELANASGIDPSTVGDYVKGGSTPNIERLFAICKALQKTPGKILDKEFENWAKLK